ncbi:NAD-dependent epimerase/dehydratase family protein [Streptomyces sp. NPDC005648]|uniref:NAD-dependent epimerase/dehydratase family protein n=1 Tax=Streptomyces sp. NPDC005648 TaxID=3157044 RepID=UPI0033B98DE2
MAPVTPRHGDGRHESAGLLVTGAGGFVGGRVVRHAGRLPDGGPPLRVLAHRRALPGAPGAVEVVAGDLGDPGSLRGLCAGVGTVVHCASLVGGTEEECEAVNVRGTEALVEEARRAGVSRVVYLSTASVYGRGTFREARPEDLVRNPGSPTSRTRAAAEDLVLAAGGTVLRPHIVYGTGDRWVGPGLLALVRAIGGGIRGRPALVSAVDVDDLARLVLGAALAPGDRLTASVYHANHPRPATADALLRGFAGAAGLPLAEGVATYERAAERLRALGRSTNPLDMMATDHWFASDRIWSDLGLAAGAGFEEGLARHAGWYRSTLRSK